MRRILMHLRISTSIWLAHRQRSLRSLLCALVLALLCGMFGGCAAFSNPVCQGVPVKRLPTEYLASPKDETRPIPLTLLRRQPPDVYRVDVGDTLGIYIEGV